MPRARAEPHGPFAAPIVGLFAGLGACLAATAVGCGGLLVARGVDYHWVDIKFDGDKGVAWCCVLALWLTPFALWWLPLGLMLEGGSAAGAPPL